VSLHGFPAGRPKGALLWSYAYPSDAGSSVQNLPSAQASCAGTERGSSENAHFVVTTWGGEKGVSPQVSRVPFRHVSASEKGWGFRRVCRGAWPDHHAAPAAPATRG
jgi:hypothetical protein